MPTIHIGGDAVPACIHITGLMCFPNDEEKSNHWIARALVGLAADSENELGSEQVGVWLGQMLEPFGGFRLLANATLIGQTNGLMQDVQPRIREGRRVGTMLHVAVMEHARGQQVSIAELCKVVRSADVQSELPESHKTVGGPRSAHNEWSRFRCVAHLWAAYVARVQLVDVEAQRWIPFDLLPGGIPAFLDLAEEYLADGQKRFAKTGPNVPVLPKKSALRIRWEST
jgi:hypothetical protein